ncbi:hypothetical protein ACFYUY_01600 [Kitasatospora sp. NPDC004745]|uniref:hypothetical protein n=1 Tax=Kitasatospora sp. NPDC004745 TaxID=3364019 RepID=UPI00368CA67F
MNHDRIEMVAVVAMTTSGTIHAAQVGIPAADYYGNREAAISIRDAASERLEATLRDAMPTADHDQIPLLLSRALITTHQYWDTLAEQR